MKATSLPLGSQGIQFTVYIKATAAAAKIQRKKNQFCFHSSGLFTLAEMESEIDSKPNGYIVVCRTFHIAQTQTRIPSSYFYIG